MNISQGFDAIRPSHSRCLILGSMPGQASLNANEYYAHPRNAFWPIVCEWFQLEPEVSYGERCQALAAQGVMLWDVLQAAHRPGSLDASINMATIHVNNFQFLQTTRSVQVVFCNGGKAYDLFQKKVVRPLQLDALAVVQLPSTSPAYAALSVAEKKSRWFDAFERYQLRKYEGN